MFLRVVRAAGGKGVTARVETDPSSANDNARG
jgi:hypothetical protein